MVAVGRPRLYEAALTEQVNFRMDREMLEHLTTEARDKHTTVAELIRTYITWGLEAK